MPRREELIGMTTNERLFVSGLMGDFDTAMETRDAAKIRAILRELFVDERSIQMIIAGFEAG